MEILFIRNQIDLWVIQRLIRGVMKILLVLHMNVLIQQFQGHFFSNITYLMWGQLIIKKKKGGQNNGGQNQGGWGQQNTGGWGQQGLNTGGWGQQNNTGGWGQPQVPANNGGWGQPQVPANNGGWGQPQVPANNGGWGQPQVPANNGGWGQPQVPANNGGWGQPQVPANNGGWGQPQIPPVVPGGQNILGFVTPNATWGNQLEGDKWVQFQQQNNNFSITNAQNFDVVKFLEQQITLIEPSPEKAKLEELRKKGQKFIDERFPPNNNSLCGEWGNVSEWKDIKWAKISQKIPNAVMFAGKPQPQDIKQGYLGDCYFLAGLAALAERPDRIYNLFILKEKNELNYYSVKMLYKGKWMTIDMDQYVPYLYNSPAFTKSVGNQLWVVLLEKAWAKMYTSYKRIEAGYPEEPLHDLTGAPIKQIYIKKGNNNKQQEWNYLLKASQNEYSMVCSSNPGSDSDTSQSGVVQGHAYTLLNAVILNHNNQQFRLIQLRNPWGKGEYTGQWSDSDPNWNSVNPAQKQRIGFKLDKDDGIFFMPFDAFWNEFRSITIAEINDNASYIYKSAKDPKEQGCYFKVQIKKDGLYSLQVDKTPERSFEDKRQNDYNYPMTTVQLGFLNGVSIQKLQGFSNNKRMTFQKYNMKAGDYIVKVKTDFDPNWEKDFDVNLAVYSEYPCVISYASNQEAASLAGRPVSWTGKETDKQVAGGWNNLAAYGFTSNQGFQDVNNGTWNNSNSGWGSNNGGWGNTGGQQPPPPQPPQQGGWGQQSGGNTGGWGQQSGGNGAGWGQQSGGNGQTGWGQQSGGNGQQGWGQQGSHGGNSGWGNQGGW